MSQVVRSNSTMTSVIPDLFRLRYNNLPTLNNREQMVTDFFSKNKRDLQDSIHGVAFVQLDFVKLLLFVACMLFIPFYFSTFPLSSDPVKVSCNEFRSVGHVECYARNVKVFRCGYVLYVTVLF